MIIALTYSSRKKHLGRGDKHRNNGSQRLAASLPPHGTPPTQKQHCCWWLSRVAARRRRERSSEEQQSSHLIWCSSVKRKHLRGFPNCHAFQCAAGNLYRQSPPRAHTYTLKHTNDRSGERTGGDGAQSACASVTEAPWGWLRLLPCNSIIY